MNLFLKPAHRILKVPNQLSAHGIPLGLSLLPEFWKGFHLNFLNLFFPRRNINLQLLEILQILLIQAVEHGDILKHRHSGLIQLLLDLIDLNLQLLIPLEQLFYIPGSILKKGELIKETLVPRIRLRFLDFYHQIRHQFSHVSAVLAADLA